MNLFNTYIGDVLVTTTTVNTLRPVYQNKQILLNNNLKAMIQHVHGCKYRK